MIAHIQGKLVEKTPTDVVIDCNGVGYHINISLHTYSLLPQADFINLYTERELFKLLLSVSGIGAGIARTMLSSLDPKQIIQAIANGDVGMVQSIKGIGNKTAQRVILDLRDKVLKIYDLDEISVAQHNINREESLSALEVLGYVRKNAEKAVDKILKESTEASVETIIKQALNNL